MKATMSTIFILSNKKTIFTYFFLTPLINIIFYSLLNKEIGNMDDTLLILSSITISSIIVYISSFSSAFTYEQNMGISDELLLPGVSMFHYWSSKIVLSSILFLIIQSYSILYLLFINSIDIIVPYFIMSLLSLYFTILLSFIFSILNWNSKNPYFLSNFFISFIYIIFGVGTLYSSFPPFLYFITIIFPYSRIATDFYTGEITNIYYYIVISLFYIIILVISIIIKKKQITKNDRKYIL